MSDFGYKTIDGSFRDLSGSVFYKDGVIYRQVNSIYKNNYDFLISSGLYKKLTGATLLIAHSETGIPGVNKGPTCKIIRPEKVPFISYPYEWCFSQLKDASLTILKIQKISLEFGMTLKDASAYNMQFIGNAPLLIDTLSFEIYRQGRPWAAYRQFCQHFLAPLTLMSKKDTRLNQLLRIYIDGIPLELTNKLLPPKTRFNLSLLTHLHLHAWFQRRFANKIINKDKKKMSKASLLFLIDNLISTIEGMKLKTDASGWADYYNKTSYAPESFEHKKKLVAKFLDEAGNGMVWDLGANTGLFSRIAADKGMETISFDNDVFCVEINYRQCVKDNEKKILPLYLDLANPTPAIGWENKERLSLLERGPAKTVLALALIHHLAISNNLPLKNIAKFFSQICEYLIIEFIPKQDPQVERLFSSREDIFPDYDRYHFEDEFAKFFQINSSEAITGSQRTLYLMRKK